MGKKHRKKAQRASGKYTQQDFDAVWDTMERSVINSLMSPNRTKYPYEFSASDKAVRGMMSVNSNDFSLPKDARKSSGDLCGSVSGKMIIDKVWSRLSCEENVGHSGMHAAIADDEIWTWLNPSDHPIRATDREAMTELPDLASLALWNLRPRDVPRVRADVVSWVKSREGWDWAISVCQTNQVLLPKPVAAENTDVQAMYTLGTLLVPLSGLRTEFREPATSYYMSADMVALTVEAALDLPDDTAYALDDAPDKCGFMCLEMPIPFEAPRSGANADTEYRYHFYAVSWIVTPDDGTTLVQFWTRRDDLEVSARLGNGDGRFSDEDLAAAIRQYAPPVVPDNEGVLLPNETWRFPHLEMHLKFLLAAWRLMKQPKLVTVDDSQTVVDRAARKQAVRAGQPPEVSLVHLRRIVRDHTQPLPAGHKPVEWSCQWRVRSFWRRPANTAPDHPKTQYVPSHTKGPADKPFRPRVYVVDR